MADKDQDVKSSETPASAPQEPQALSDEQVEGIAGGISSEPVYTQTGMLLDSTLKTSALGGLISAPSILTLPRDVLAGK